MGYRVVIKPAAEKSLNKLPLEIQQRITRKLIELSDDPRPRGAIKLAGEQDRWRVRVGVYRMIYEIHDDATLVLVLIIAHRREAYR